MYFLNSHIILHDWSSLHATGEKMGSEELSGLCQVTELVISELRVKLRSIWLPSVMSCCFSVHTRLFSCAPLPLFPCLVGSTLKVLFSSHVGQPTPRKNALLCSSCLHASWSPTRQKLCACLCCPRGTRICLCFVCNAHRTGLLIMPQARLHSTSGIMNYPAPAKMSHTMATKETYLFLTLSSACFSLFPFLSLVICLASCNWNIFFRI